MVLAALYFFRSAALAVYVLCGLFTDNYVLSVSFRKLSLPTNLWAKYGWRWQIVIVVVLLSLDFWNVKVRPPHLLEHRSCPNMQLMVKSSALATERSRPNTSRPAVLERGG